MGKVTLKIVQKYEANAEGKKVVRLRITANRVNRFFSTFILIAPSYFNPKGSREKSNWVRAGHPNAPEYNTIIQKIWDRTIEAIDASGLNATAEQIKAVLEGKNETVEAVAEPVIKVPKFLAYCDFYIKRRGESTTTDTYIEARNAFAKYLNHLVDQKHLTEADVSFADLTIAFTKSWRTWALIKYANNTAWLYHSRLKSMYFQAIEDWQELAHVPTVVTDPLRRVKILRVKTKKQRLYEDEIDRIAALDLEWGTTMRQVRDICLMMYYAQGMRIGDALRIRLRNYAVVGSEHRLIYEMHKSKKQKNALLPQQAIDLLAPYRAEAPHPDATIFKFLRKEIDAGYTDYALSHKVKSKVATVKESLYRILERAQVDKSISAHVFRHSFADLARRNGLDWLDIQKAMGHERFATTEEYMEELDESSSDKAVNLFNRITTG